MEEDKMVMPTPISDDFVPKKPTAYDMLIRQSRKMGGLATRTYDLTKEFLYRDTPQPQTFMQSWNEAKQHQSANSGSYDQNNNFSQQNKQSSPSVSGERREALTLDPRDNLQRVVEKSHQVLAGARTVMLPTNIFPDSVIVDRTKVTLTKRTFFWTANVISIRIEDVLNVATNTGPFFGSLTVSSRVMNSTDHYEIDYFWRKDALYLKQLIQGYVIAQHNQIDTSHLERDELIKTLLELGQDSDF